VTPSVTRTALLAGGLLAAAIGGFACTDDSGPNHVDGTAGSSAAGTGGGAGSSGSGGGGGSAGTSGGGSGGGNPSFMAVAPCNAESDYMTGTMVTFPMSATNVSYSPKCLRVLAGATVTFSGEFSEHPLAPSTKRGTLTGSPITSTTSGSSKGFVFPTPGFYAYYCTVHGPSDGAAGMVGVVWVE
jgi:plastocyanin